MAIAGDVVPQQGWWFIKVDDHHVYITVIVEIAKRAPSAAVGGSNTRTGLIHEFFEFAAAEIPENETRRFQRKLWKPGFNFRIYGSGDDRQIGPAIVIEI